MPKHAQFLLTLRHLALLLEEAKEYRPCWAQNTNLTILRVRHFLVFPIPLKYQIASFSFQWHWIKTFAQMAKPSQFENDTSCLGQKYHTNVLLREAFFVPSYRCYLHRSYLHIGGDGISCVGYVIIDHEFRNRASLFRTQTCFLLICPCLLSHLISLLISNSSVFRSDFCSPCCPWPNVNPVSVFWTPVVGWKIKITCENTVMHHLGKNFVYLENFLS